MAKPTFDTKQIDALAANDPNFKKEIIRIFLEQIEDFSTSLRNLLDKKNWKDLAREAHTAKSSALTFGMEETGKLLKQIQLFAQDGKTDELPAMIEEAIEQLQLVKPELENICNNI